MRPNFSTDQAQAATTTNPTEKQMEEDNYYINIVFSIESLALMKDKNGRYKFVKVRYDRPHKIHTLVWEEKDFTQDLAGMFMQCTDKTLPLFIDCSELPFIDELGDSRIELIKDVIDKVIGCVRHNSRGVANKHNVHFMITAFSPIEELMFCLSRLLDHPLPKENLFEGIVSKAEMLLSTKITELQSIGVYSIVEYAAVYESFYSEIDRMSDYEAAIEVAFHLRQCDAQRVAPLNNAFGRDYLKKRKEAEAKGEKYHEPDEVYFNGRIYNDVELDNLQEEIWNRLSKEERKRAGEELKERLNAVFCRNEFAEGMLFEIAWGLACTFCSPLSIIDLGRDIYKFSKGEADWGDLVIDAIGMVPVVGVVKAGNRVHKIAKIGKKMKKADKESKSTREAIVDLERAEENHSRILHQTESELDRVEKTISRSYNSVENLKKSKYGMERLEELQKLKKELEKDKFIETVKLKETKVNKEKLIIKEKEQKLKYTQYYNEKPSAVKDLNDYLGKSIKDYFGLPKLDEKFDGLFKTLKSAKSTNDLPQYIENAFQFGFGYGTTAYEAVLPHETYVFNDSYE